MVAYRFYARADEAQDKIWSDTVEASGEKPADACILGLHAYLQRLCRDRLIWRRLPQRLAVQRSAYIGRYEHHYVFLREFDSGDLGVMSVLQNV
ncbi:type II toxin-antitoxin system RelE/ParE family toxin [Rhizobium lentis]|uniref:type II toxin-antitoxin system RelE/ParE family toxin n=2 Tax=Rhizobium/Agrobacterium group TaxID=227290 RepID=UPI002180BB22|nr:type II toxin-antitoxin system RelE/ParE family toxin [Rhizobium lentis]